jgi:hypothetical protein
MLELMQYLFEQCQPLHRNFRQGRHAAGARLLVPLHLQPNHFFVANPINRFSVGTKNKDLKRNADGSLAIYVQADESTDPVHRANWLPTPKGDFSLYIRAYWPKPPILDGSWTPLAVRKLK